MKGDRVQIISGTIYENKDALVYVYAVQLDENGTPVRAADGSVFINSQGGVKTGTTGVIMGPPEKVYRLHLKDAENVSGLGANEYVNVVPVMLDTYQQLGWFPTEKIRVVAGGRAV